MKKIVRRVKVAHQLFRQPFVERQKSQAKRFRTKYAEFHAKYKVQDNIILYESSYGRGMICNPYAIFKAFTENNLFQNFIHVWALESLEHHQGIINSFKRFNNVIFVERQSDDYLKYLVSAKYLINNTSFSEYFSKKKEQIYVNTWHSITVKTLGFDMPDGKITSGNMLRNLLACDYIISANKFTTKIFKEAYKLNGIYQGKMIENGHPRNDLVKNTPREDITGKLQDSGVSVEAGKKIILYAPTWKGNDYFNPQCSIDEYLSVLDFLKSNINIDEYQVLIKPHPTVYKHLKSKEDKNEFIPAYIDTNELLSVVDILISDYSSIYFDYLLTDRPVLFYIPDIEEYKIGRGVYFDIKDLPGPASKKLEDICSWINNIDDVHLNYKKIYNETKAWACEYDDSAVSQKIIDIIFNRNEESYNILDNFGTDKKRILMYGGGLKTNGVTFSLLSLLNHIDYSKFDVSLIVFNIKDKTVAQNIKKINDNVRILARVSTNTATISEDIRDKYVRHLGLGSSYLKKLFPQKMYEREYSRCFGMSRFDYIVDFSGYGPFFNYLMMQATGSKRIIWQHSDLLPDMKRKVKGHEKFYRDRTAGIRAAITLYDYYDKVVSCGRAVMDVNKENLATKNTIHKFTYATNATNFQRIIDGLKDETLFHMNNEKYIVLTNNNINAAIVNLELAKMPSEETINFVTMGRLSPEKNHVNLIEAFARIYQENEKCRLYIIGEGDLRKKLEKLIETLNLKNAVFLMGALSNPFSFMKYCDCFVFPSIYEGQGLVVLEARIVGLPIIVSDFPASKDVLLENGQLVIEKDVDSIYEGLKAFLEGKVPSEYKFDQEAYNRKCYQEFEQLFD